MYDKIKEIVHDGIDYVKNEFSKAKDMIDKVKDAINKGKETYI